MMRPKTYTDNLSKYFNENQEGLFFQDRNGRFMHSEEINKIPFWEIEEMQLHVFKT